MVWGQVDCFPKTTIYVISNQPTVQSGWVSRGRVLGCDCGLAVDVAVAMAVTATITLAMDFIGFGAIICIRQDS